MTNDCKTCPVSTGTHKPAEAVHQIAEPQTDALDLADKLEKDVWQATPLRLSKVVELAAEALRAQSARIAELESQLDAIGAGGVEPLRKQAAAPQAVQAAVPLFWVRLLRDGMYEGPVHNNSVGGKMLRDEKPGEWHPLYLHAAPAHPAGGLPAQAAQPSDELIEKVDAWFAENTGLGGCSDKDVAELAAIFATHPTQQGLDDRDVFERAYAEHAIAYAGLDAHVDDVVQRVKDGRDGNSYKNLHDSGAWVGWNLALAAQAKQGG